MNPHVFVNYFDSYQVMVSRSTLPTSTHPVSFETNLNYYIIILYLL